MQIAWHIHKGSEAFYRYTLEGSADGTNWNVPLNHTDASDSRVSKTYGLTSDLLPAAPNGRYMRISVKQAVLKTAPTTGIRPRFTE